VQHPPGERQAERTGEKTDQRAFGQKLLEEPAAGGSQRQAYRDLLAPDGRPRQQKAGDGDRLLAIGFRVVRPQSGGHHVQLGLGGADVIDGGHADDGEGDAVQVEYRSHDRGIRF
jgi:hypothetical protein